MAFFNYDYLGIMADMAGCPNRCRHCWLGSHKNGSISVPEFREIAAQFKGWRDGRGRGIAELGFFSWWREPDFRDDYRELWELERELSSPGRAERFELLSSWRLARDEGYAKWAATLEPKVCQITFFGLEAITDWSMRRPGAFRDQLKATERCREAGIEPRWQLFLTKRGLPELEGFLRLIKEYKITSFFIGGLSPEGNGYELESERLEESDLAALPPEMIKLSRDGLELLGRTEEELLPELLRNDRPANSGVLKPCLAIDADFNVYPNIAEPAEWWRLGNLKTDGVDGVMKTLIEGATTGFYANTKIPLSELAHRYGVPDSERLYDRDDLICRFLHQWGADYSRAQSSK